MCFAFIFYVVTACRGSINELSDRNLTKFGYDNRCKCSCICFHSKMVQADQADPLKFTTSSDWLREGAQVRTKKSFFWKDLSMSTKGSTVQGTS